MRRRPPEHIPFFWKKLRGLLLCFVLPLLLFGLVVNAILRRDMTAVSSADSLARVQQTQDQIELIFSEMDSLNITFGMNSSVIDLLNRSLLHNKQGTLSLELDRLVINYLIPAVAARRYIHSLYIYIDNPYGRFITDANFLTTLDRYYDTTWYDSYVLHKGDAQLFWSNLRTLRRFPAVESDTQVITLYKKLWRRDGVVVLNLSKRYFDKQLAGIVSSPAQQLLVMNSDREVLMQSDAHFAPAAPDLDTLLNETQSLTADVTIGGAHYLLTRSTSDVYGWTYLMLTPHADLYALSDRFSQLVYLMLGLSVLVCIGISVQYVRTSQRSVQRIISLLDAIEHDAPLPDVGEVKEDAYAHIMQNIVMNYGKQRSLNRQLEQKKNEAKTLEMQALQAQISPHFLFNTLQSVYWMSYELTGGQNDVSRTLENMSGILDYSMSAKDELIPLSQELMHTRAYIDIQQLRYKGRIHVAWEIDPAAETHHTIKLLLQPLIENAIMHGMHWEGDRPLHILVRIACLPDHLALLVQDDGRGIEPEELETIRSRLGAQSDEGHIGIYSCNRRLCLAFGSEYALHIESTVQKGTSVHVRLPKIQ